MCGSFPSRSPHSRGVYRRQRALRAIVCLHILTIPKIDNRQLFEHGIMSCRQKAEMCLYAASSNMDGKGNCSSLCAIAEGVMYRHS